MIVMRIETGRSSYDNFSGASRWRTDMIRETARASRDEVVAAASTVMRPDQKRGLLSPCDAAISLERRANEIASSRIPSKPKWP